VLHQPKHGEVEIEGKTIVAWMPSAVWVKDRASPSLCEEMGVLRKNLP
jgi:hypothetical protein